MQKTLAFLAILGAALVLSCVVLGVVDVQAREVGRALPLNKAPHIRSGVWGIRAILGGKYPQPERAECFADMTIVSPRHRDCEQWSLNFLPPDTYVLTDSCRLGSKVTHARRVSKGDLTKHFTVTDEYSTEISGVEVQKVSDEVFHTFYNSRCPPATIMPVKHTF